MSTKVYGYSDDNFSFHGDLHDEIGCYDTDLIITFSDGTVIRTHYGKCEGGSEPGQGMESEGIWHISVLKQGTLIDKLEFCHDSEAAIYSNVLYFKDGLTGFKWKEV